MNIYNTLHSALSTVRDKYAPVSHTSTFRQTGQITPEEFLAAGDFLTQKFPSWSWSDASSPAKRVSYFPPGKQFLVTRGVPCHRRLGDDFAGDAGEGEMLVHDELLKVGQAPGDEDEGWLRTGGEGMAASMSRRVGDVRTVEEGGQLGIAAEEEEDEIPDMEEDEEDDEEAIIRDDGGDKQSKTRTYTLYITYTPYYRTPRMYMSGYDSASKPLQPQLMMEDVVGDYKDKTVTLEDFPFFDGGLKMASVHPCKHAAVMKVLLDRADAALRLRMQKIKDAKIKAKREGLSEEVEVGKVGSMKGMEGLVDDMQTLKVGGEGSAKGGEDWEVLDEDAEREDESAIRVDQYMVVFLKFIASVTPGIEHDYTMGV